MTASPLGTNPNTTHDRLHAGVSATIDVYVRLSQAYAAKGDARLALLSLWTADVWVLQSLLWESGLGSAPDPDAQLAAVGRAVDVSLRLEAERPEGAATVPAALERARTALMAVFDESMHIRLKERFASLDHLHGLTTPGAGDIEEARRSRLGDRTAQELTEDLRVAAADCMAVSTLMAGAGLTHDALEQARQADMASFEAYLVEAATAVGDTSLATVDLRWDIATSAVARIDDVPADLAEAVHQLRETLVQAVGPAEGEALRATFERVRAPAA